jgi:hypothetical protein
MNPEFISKLPPLNSDAQIEKAFNDGVEVGVILALEALDEGSPAYEAVRALLRKVIGDTNDRAAAYAG